MAVSTASLAQTTRASVAEYELLLRTLDRTGGAGSALLDTVEDASRTALAGPVSTRRGFDGEAAADGADVASDEDVVAAAMTELALGNALLAAGRALGEDGSGGDTTALRDATADLADVAAALDAQAVGTTALRHGFDGAPASPDAATAQATFRGALEVLLDGLATRSTQVVTETVPEIVERVPVLGDVVATIGKRLDLGAHAARFARLGLAAIDRALRALSTLLPAGALTDVRTWIAEMLARLTEGNPASAVVGWAIGTDSVRADVAALGAPEGADAAAFDAATAQLNSLADRFDAVARTAQRIVKLVLAGAATLALFVALPHAALVVGSALALVVAAVLVVATDYTDARPLPGAVVGARSIVRAVWG